jgi:mycofactocin precursor
MEQDEPAAQDEQPVVEEDLLVEDVSIDGMCGVY